MRRLALTFVAALGFVALAAPAAQADLDDLVLVSAADGLFTPTPGADESIDPSISADGRMVAFGSQANNLSTANDDTFFAIYARDLVAGTTVLVSRADGVAGAGASAGSFGPEISANGRYVVFESSAVNLSTENNDSFNNVYRRDLVTNSTTLVSRANGPAGAGADAAASHASISADGTRVAFESAAENLAADDAAATGDVYVRDLVAGTTTLVSRETGAAGAPGDNQSGDPAISADGKHVGFLSHADNLSTDDDDGEGNVFVRDLAAHTTELVSRADGPSGAGGELGGDDPSLSADGRRIAFESSSDNLLTDDNDSAGNIYVRDMEDDTLELVTRETGVAGLAADDDSSDPSISHDGTRVAFESGADNLSAENDDGFNNVYVRDLELQTTTWISRATGPTGVPGDDHSSHPYMAGDGRFVAFRSRADAISTLDDDSVLQHIFRRHVFGDPPVSTQAPRLTGSAVAGGVLSCSQGTWANGPTQFAFQFRRDGAPIAGATAATYTVGSGDVGRAIDCVVTATSRSGRTSATSNSVSPPAQGAPGGTGARGPTGAAGPPGAPGPGGPATAIDLGQFAHLTKTRLRGVAGKPLTVRYFAAGPGTVRLRVKRGGKVVATVRGRARSGANSLKIRRGKLKRAGRYSLAFVATASDGRRAVDSARLTIAKMRRR
jgi:Tol biopolymer transport system component